jgi:hypothetical protein
MRVRFLSTQVRAQRDNSHSVRYLNRQHSLITGHNNFCLSGHRALENPIVRIVIEHADTFLRLNEFGKLRQKKSRTT